MIDGATMSFTGWDGKIITKFTSEKPLELFTNKFLELAEYFSKEYNFAKKLKFTILKKGMEIPEELSFKENLWIYRMHSLRPDGLNVHHDQYRNEMYWLLRK